MSSEIAIYVDSLSKCYQIYAKPHERLLQMVMRGRKKYYKDFWALKDVTFSIKKGETVGIIGRNGSGKSTLLQLICGTLNPTEGEISVRGKVAALLELGAGFNPEFTGIENIYLSSSLYGFTRKQIDDNFNKIVSFADIGEHVLQPVKTYSSGMYVRLAFAIIAHVDADILVIDEALAVGDVFFQQKCMRFLQEFKKRGGTLIIVSHDTAAISALCDKAVLLKRDVNNYECVEGSVDIISRLYLKDLYRDLNTSQNISPELNIPKEPVIQPKNELSASYAIQKKGDMTLKSQYFISPFRNTGESFGSGNGEIEFAEFRNEFGEAVEHLTSGVRVSLVVRALAKTVVKSPAIAFLIKDRQGQFLTAESTDTHFNTNQLRMAPNDMVEVEFKFDVPSLIRGTYTIDLAFSDGTTTDHVQLHWLHDAIQLECIRGYHVVGIVGVPNLDITWSAVPKPLNSSQSGI